MTFWLDAPRNLVIYQGQPGILPQYIPDLKVLSEKYFAVKRNLRNLMVLAYYNWPVPPAMTEENYDWPIEPGKTVLQHQKAYANFTVLHPRMMNLGDPGCVAGDTLIETDKGPIRIDALVTAGENIRVYASTDEGIRLVRAECPFVKGFEPLYRVTFESGCTIDVTSKHVFLTCRGWISCAELLPGECLPKFDVFHPLSTSEFYLSALRRDALRSKQTALNSQDYSYNLVCDEPPLQGEDIDLVSIPLQVDVPRRAPASSQKDARDTKCKHTNRFASDPPSMPDFGRPFDRAHKEFRVGESTSKLICTQHRVAEQFLPTSSPPRLVPPNPELTCGCFDQNPEHNEFYVFERDKQSPDNSRLAYAPLRESKPHPQSACELYPDLDCLQRPLDLPLLDTVVHIRYIKTDFYYDMHVPVHENYIAHGVCNHNTMKTISTLWAVDFLMLQSREKFKAMVVAPLTILETTWAKTIFCNFLGRRSFEVLTGAPDRRLKNLEKDVDIYLVNHDGIKVGAHIRRKVDPRHPKQKRIELDGFSAEIAARSDIKLIVIDEAHGFGEPSSARSGVANMLFGVGKRPMLKQLTGTPNANAPTDCYGIAKLSNNAYGKSWTGFRLETMMKVSEFKWVPQKDGYDKARRLLTPAIRFSLDEIWDGPPMTVQRRKVELTEDQKKEMKRLRQELQVISQSGHAISAANESAARQKLIQLSLGAVYDGDHVAHLIDASPRYRELEEIVESTERKVVVFVPITSVVHLVVKYLRAEWKKKKLPWKCDFINGEVKAGRERDAVINNFVSDPDFKLVVADPQTATEGINEFVIADTVVWFGATDRAKAWIQGNARVRRPGQKYPSTCFQLVSNKLEEEIFDRLENNTSMQGLMLDAIRKGEF